MLGHSWNGWMCYMCSTCKKLCNLHEYHWSYGFHVVRSCNSCVVLTLQITELCLDFICYDPNYNYGSDDEDEFMETDMEDDEEE